MRKIVTEKVPREADAQARRTRLGLRQGCQRVARVNVHRRCRLGCCVLHERGPAAAPEWDSAAVTPLSRQNHASGAAQARSGGKKLPPKAVLRLIAPASNRRAGWGRTMQGKIALEEHFAIPETLRRFDGLFSGAGAAGGRANG